MRSIFTLTVILACTSCALNLKEAKIETPADYIYNNGFNGSNAAIDERWWEAFCDPVLNSLEERALLQNRDLAIATTNVEASRNFLRVARAEFLPSLSFDAIADVTHEEEVTDKEYTLEAALDWEISLFGELRNTKKAAVASFLQEEWNYRGVRLSLTSEVATSYFTLLQYQRSLYMATRSYELRCKATALVDSMYRYGMSSGTDLMQAKSLVYSAKVEMQRYERAVATTSLSLTTLLGELPQEVNWNEIGRSLIEDELPFDIPIGLPSSLLERRPDIMKSYFAMAEAAAKVGVNRAKRYPSISLTGGGGLYATTLEGLTSNDPLLWSITGEVITPIFSWEALRRKEMISKENYEAAVLDYEQTVIQAISDVEKALSTIDTYSSETAASTALVLANSKIVENVTALYHSGLSDYLNVIDAERELYSSQISLISIVAQQYINYINLFKALGGGLQ